MPLVVTVHDLAVLRHPETFNPWTRHYSRSCVPRVARAASRIIAVSEFTKRELVELLGTPPEQGDGHPQRRGRGLLARRARGRGRLRARRWARSSRGRTSRASQEAARLAGAELRVVGARGWGGVQAAGWLGRVVRRRARASLPGREVRRLRVAVRGLRPADRRGDGLRHAGGDEPRRRDRGDGRRRSRARRPVRPGGDRGRDRGSSDATRRAAPARPRARAAPSRGTRRRALPPRSTARWPHEPRRHRRRRARPPAHGRRDVRPQPPAPPARGGGGRLRFAALTRRPDLVPTASRR